MDKLTLGRLVRRHRSAMGLTQREVADALGTSQTTVSAWETGVNEPSIADLTRLCELFGLQLDISFRPQLDEKLPDLLAAWAQLSAGDRPMVLRMLLAAPEKE